MTSVPHVSQHISPAIPVTDRSPAGPRLRIKPKAPTTGYVDGGWWPRSGDLSRETPALAHALGVRLGRVTRVAYALDAWDTTPRRITVDGGTVRLEGFHSQDRHVVHVSGSDHERLSLLVVPPEANVAAAHDAMTRAAGRGNADHPAVILTESGVLTDASAPRPRPVRDDDPRSRWMTDGGSLVHERGEPARPPR